MRCIYLQCLVKIDMVNQHDQNDRDDDFGYIRVEGFADDMDGGIGFLNIAFLNFIPSQAEYDKANTSSHGGGMSHKNMAKEKFNELVDAQIYPEEKNEKEGAQGSNQTNTGVTGAKRCSSVTAKKKVLLLQQNKLPNNIFSQAAKDPIPVHL